MQLFRFFGDTRIIVSMGQLTCLVKAQFISKDSKSHTPKCLLSDMDHRLCFQFCQGHYERMQSHRQEIQSEMSYNLQSTINHALLTPHSLSFPSHILNSAAFESVVAACMRGHVHSHTNNAVFTLVQELAHVV